MACSAFSLAVFSRRSAHTYSVARIASPEMITTSPGPAGRAWRCRRGATAEPGDRDRDPLAAPLDERTDDLERNECRVVVPVALDVGERRRRLFDDRGGVDLLGVVAPDRVAGQGSPPRSALVVPDCARPRDFLTGQPTWLTARTVSRRRCRSAVESRSSHCGRPRGRSTAKACARRASGARWRGGRAWSARVFVGRPSVGVGDGVVRGLAVARRGSTHDAHGSEGSPMLPPATAKRINERARASARPPMRPQPADAVSVSLHAPTVRPAGKGEVKTSTRGTTR